MNGATTLDGYFFEDDGQNLVQRIEQAIAIGRLAVQSRILISWQQKDTGTFPTLTKKDISRLEPGGIRPLCEELKAEVERLLGNEPNGTLKVRMYESGRSQDNAVDFTRQIQPAGETPAGTVPNMETLNNRLLNRVQTLERINVEKDAQIAANSALLSQLAVAQTKTIETLATQRSVATTANDMGSLTTIIGLGVLALTWPVVRSAFNLPKNASINDLLRLAQENTTAFMGRMTSLLESPPEEHTPTSSPKPALTADAPQAPEVPTENQAAPTADSGSDPDAVINRALKDPVYREALREKIQAHWQELAA